MDNQAQIAQPTKPISDDQELAKVLAGITNGANTNNIAPKESTVVEPTTPIQPVLPPTPTPIQMPNPISAVPHPDITDGMLGYAEPMEKAVPQIVQPQPLTSGNLEGIRKDALSELRPLVDKLDLAPEEKFDIYLLLLRSTDDTTLIAPAHQAAKNIIDESKKAQALLDVIKEIDYLSKPDQPEIN
jgi:hypothetical protein